MRNVLMGVVLVITLKIVCAPARIQMWDESGEPLKLHWVSADIVQVDKKPGAVSVETFDQDCGAVRFHMSGGGRWWKATVECGNGPRYLDLTRSQK